MVECGGWVGEEWAEGWGGGMRDACASTHLTRRARCSCCTWRYCAWGCRSRVPSHVQSACGPIWHTAVRSAPPLWLPADGPAAAPLHLKAHMHTPRRRFRTANVKTTFESSNKMNAINLLCISTHYQRLSSLLDPFAPLNCYVRIGSYTDK